MKTDVINVRNVNHAFCTIWWKFNASGLVEKSRNGPVRVMPGPFVTEYRVPQERVLFSPQRDANPIFHLMEAIWMLAGQNNVDWLAQFMPNIANYADDGIIHGAYGHRWREHFDCDQLLGIVDLLTQDPPSRQAVLQMWDPGADLYGDWRDRPCNTNAYFDLRGGALNMTVCCRSNDALWGAYGANVVHFSVLQEVLASTLCVPIGSYTQFSNNFHVYTDLPMVKELLTHPPFAPHDPYEAFLTSPFDIQVGSLTEFLVECEEFVHGGTAFRNNFLQSVAFPLKTAFKLRRLGDATWRKFVQRVPDCDWKLAFTEWCERREK